MNLAGRLSYFFLTLYLVNLGVVIMLFYKGGLSPVFLAVNTISILGLMCTRAFSLKLYIPIAAIALIGFYLLGFVAHFNASRITSLLYSFFYLGSFLIAIGNVPDLFTRQSLGRVLRLVIYLHLFTMIIQQAGFVLHLPIINLNPEFADDYFEKMSLFRFNALSNEPSYGATLVVIIAYVYYYLFPNLKEEAWRFWLPTIYLFVFFQSALATILAPVLFFVVVAGKKWWLLPLGIVILLAIALNLETDNRVVNLIQNLDLNNFSETFMEVDLSGAFRVVPTIFYFQQVNVFSSDFWIGHGIDYGGEFVSRLMPGVETFLSFIGGAIPFMLFDYGLLCFIAFLWFLHSVAAWGSKVGFWILAIFILLNANFSTQLFWFFIAVCTASRMIVAAERKAKQAVVQHDIPTAEPI